MLALWQSGNPAVLIEDFPDKTGGRRWFEVGGSQDLVIVQVVGNGFRPWYSSKILRRMITNVEDALDQYRVRRRWGSFASARQTVYQARVIRVRGLSKPAQPFLNPGNRTV